MPLGCDFLAKFPFIYVFRYEKFELGLHFETGSSIMAVSVHAQWKNHKNAFKMWFSCKISLSLGFSHWQIRIWGSIWNRSNIMAVSVHAQWKNHKNAFKMWFSLQNSPLFIFFGMRNSNLGSILKPEVVLWLFLCTRSEKSQNAFKMWFSCKIPLYLGFSHSEIRIWSRFWNRK